MPKSYRTSVRIDLVFIETQLPNARNGLACERLVELNDVNVLEPNACPLQQCWYGVYRANAHLVGGATLDLSANEAAKWLQSTLFSPRTSGKYGGGCAVRYLRSERSALREL